MSVEQFLKNPGLILDVRSPSEYAQGHIPGAHSFPLFSDQERAEIGTLYKKSGKAKAVELGLKIVGPKLYELVKRAKELLEGKPAKVHCWRGGMRSGSVQWLLRTAGMQAETLQGGYKAFRKWVLQTLNIPREIHVLGGFTGCAKTQILHTLREQGEEILDLEFYAHHKGSSFGMIGQLPQPTNEHFENEIAVRLSQTDPTQILWVEDESRMIGHCKIPDYLYTQMRTAPLIKIEKNREERINILMHEYGNCCLQDLIPAIERLQKKLGGQRIQEIVNFIQVGELRSAIAILLDYYDRTYTHGLSRRTRPPIVLNVENLSINACASIIQSSKLENSNRKD